MVNMSVISRDTLAVKLEIQRRNPLLAKIYRKLDEIIIDNTPTADVHEKLKLLRKEIKEFYSPKNGFVIGEEGMILEPFLERDRMFLYGLATDILENQLMYFEKNGNKWHEPPPFSFIRSSGRHSSRRSMRNGDYG
jgi:hypothetical protein